MNDRIHEEYKANTAQSTLEASCSSAQKHGTLIFNALLAVLIALHILFPVCRVNGTSMEPSVHDGSIILSTSRVDNLDYEDIVIFPNVYRGNLVKRVIGLPGDTIEIRDSVVFRNGEPLDESYISQGYFGPFDLTGPVTVEEGHVFVLGDNRPDSLDSRSSLVGQVPIDTIKAVLICTLFSPMHIDPAKI